MPLKDSIGLRSQATGEIVDLVERPLIMTAVQ